MALTHGHFLQIATIIASASYCKRRKVGCVIVQHNRIVSTGYNGTLPGFRNECEEENGETKTTTVHAEFNAIVHAARLGVSLEGAYLYLTFSPCIHCAKLIIQSGITAVYYLERHSDMSGLDLLRAANIVVNEY